MANALLSEEGYLSGRVTITVEGVGAHPVNSGRLGGAQLGCQVNLDDGLDLGRDVDTDIFHDDSLVGVGPDIGTTLRSGGIKAVGFGAKSLKGPVATISVLDAYVQVDECGGVLTARLFASATISRAAQTTPSTSTARCFRCEHRSQNGSGAAGDLGRRGRHRLHCARRRR
jgi:hypothetical protein